MKHSLLCFVPALLTCLTANSEPSDLKHRFIAADESGHQILMIDGADPGRNWVVKQHVRDLQLVGEDRLLVSVKAGGNGAKNGYLELELGTGEVLKRFESPVGMFKQVTTARRAMDGSTYLGGYAPGGIRIVRFDSQDKPVLTIDCPAAIQHIRLMRLTSTGTFLLGSGPVVYEVGRDGTIVWQQSVKGANHIYKAVRLPNGNTLLASGYGAFLVEMAPDGTWIRTFGRDPQQKVKHPTFFADFQLLANGNIVVANWMGHKREDSRKGEQLVEYAADGKIVWTWHDPDLAGCIHGLILLDGLNTHSLHHEQAGVLSPGR